MEDGNCLGQWYNAKHKSGICMLLGEVLYRVCIARAAVNESVCEDSHAEHVQFATAAVSV